MSYHFIDNDAALAEFLTNLSGVDAIALDTEFIRVNTFYPIVGLLQICSGEDVFLIDPLAIGELDGLRTLLTSPDTIKVMHSASEDIEVFKCWLGVKPAPLYDSQVAAAIIGKGFGLGYRALVEHELGHELSKEASRSDWLARPLTPQQLDYAALDVLYLLDIYRRWQNLPLLQQRFDWVLQEGEVAIDKEELSPLMYYTRVKGASRLTPAQLAVLQLLCAWREERARERDKPRNWIVPDNSLLAVAQAMPQNSNALHAISELSPKVLGRYGKLILQKTQEAMALPVEQLPQALPGPLSSSQRTVLKQMRAQVKDWAQALEIEPQVLLSTKDMELMLRQGIEEYDMPSHWQGWRRDCVIEPMLNWLEERTK